MEINKIKIAASVCPGQRAIQSSRNCYFYRSCFFHCLISRLFSHALSAFSVKQNRIKYYDFDKEQFSDVGAFIILGTTIEYNNNIVF